MAETVVKFDDLLRVRVTRTMADELRDLAWENRTTTSHYLRQGIEKILTEHRTPENPQPEDDGSARPV